MQRNDKRFSYEFEPHWGQLPPGWQWGYVRAVAVDSQDRVYVVHEPPHEVVVFNQEGRFLTAWEDSFGAGAHALQPHCEADGEYMYVTDMVRHVVVKCALDGRPVWTLGTPGRDGAWGQPFNRPCDLAFGPSGDIFVADGYGNRHIHHFDPDGKLIHSWGGAGDGPGQFGSVHDILYQVNGAEHRLWVADHPNNRLQIFSTAGEFAGQVDGLLHPSGLCADGNGTLYCSEEGGRITILDRGGAVLTRVGEPQGGHPGRFMDPHSLWLDSRSDIYVAEVNRGRRVQKLCRR